MNVYTQRVSKLVSSMEPKLIELRRHIHAHPELSRAEYETTQLVAAELRAIGLKPRILPDSVALTCDIGAPVAATGVAVIGFRADPAAVAVSARTSGPYRSTVPGSADASVHAGPLLAR